MTGMDEVSVLVEENENRFSVHGEINNSLLMVVFALVGLAVDTAVIGWVVTGLLVVASVVGLAVTALVGTGSAVVGLDDTAMTKKWGNKYQYRLEVN